MSGGKVEFQAKVPPTGWLKESEDISLPKWSDPYWELRAIVVAGEERRPSKRMISRQSFSTFSTGLDIAFLRQEAWILTPPEISQRSIWILGGPLLFLPNKPPQRINIPLYNGGFEPQYIEHGQLIALLWVK